MDREVRWSLKAAQDLEFLTQFLEQRTGLESARAIITRLYSQIVSFIIDKGRTFQNSMASYRFAGTSRSQRSERACSIDFSGPSARKRVLPSTSNWTSGTLFARRSLTFSGLATRTGKRNRSSGMRLPSARSRLNSRIFPPNALICTNIHQALHSQWLNSSF